MSHTQQFGLSVGTGERCSQSSRVEAEKERLNDECDQKERLNDECDQKERLNDECDQKERLNDK